MLAAQDIITLPLMVFEDFDGPVNAVLDWMVLVQPGC